jgi:hypothetical protein
MLLSHYDQSRQKQIMKENFIMEPISIESNAFKSFFSSLQSYIDVHMGKHFPTNPRQEFYSIDGRRYIKVCIHGSGVYCFIDKRNGDVLKPAGWTAPAKHARGNIFDESNGLKHCGPYGVAYLR